MDDYTLLHGDCLEEMAAMEAGSVDAVVTDLAAGIAGEHLVCADLLLAGYRAFLTDQNCPYDVAVEVDGSLVRIQVKTTRCPRTIPQRVQHVAGYIWHVRRAGKRGQRTYSDGEFDMLALVALDTREIAYVPMRDCRQTFHIRPTSAPGYKQTGVCAGCGCDMDLRTPKCAVCKSRHWRRTKRGAPQGKRFTDYPFERALAAAGIEV